MIDVKHHGAGLGPPDKGQRCTTRTMSGPVFVALVNPKSGGNVGNQLLHRFKEILNEDRVYNLSDEDHPGPAKALEDHKNVEHLRLIGRCDF